MKIKNLILLLIICTGLVSQVHSAQGVAIQRVINNTRSELGQLAASTEAQEIAKLMQRFDAQYQTWNQTCGGGENFDPRQAGDACKAMADQMRETGVQLYGKLAEYLPNVAARYEQGAGSAARIVQADGSRQSPADLFRAAMGGTQGAKVPGVRASEGEDSPFDLETDDFPDPTEEMFSVLEKLVPDFGKETPEVIRAGNTQVSMMKKAKKARYLAAQFEKARFVLESQREYGEIIFNATQAVSAMPKILGLQYTGTRLQAKPNQRVLDYYRGAMKTKKAVKAGKLVGGLEPRM
jgi:hypothetical protein